jgi:hypothetical protein
MATALVFVTPPALPLCGGAIVRFAVIFKLSMPHRRVRYRAALGQHDVETRCIWATGFGKIINLSF